MDMEQFHLEERAQAKLDKARLHVVLDSPFFGSLLGRLNTHLSYYCPTAWTDGTTIGINPHMIENVSFEDLKGIIVHEVGHVVFKHSTRRGERDPEIWNIAGDYVINAMVRAMGTGISLPSWVLFDQRFKDSITEDVYAAIWSKLPEQEKQARKNAQSGGRPRPDGQGNKGDSGQMGEPWKDGSINWKDGKGLNGQIGEVIDFAGKGDKDGDGSQPGAGSKPTPGEIAEFEADLDTAIRQAVAIAQKQGKLPASMAETIKAAGESKTSWYDQLSQYLVTMLDDDYSWKRPNITYVSTGAYIPSIEGEGLPPIVMAIDVSGSMTQDQLRQCGREVVEIVDTFGCDIHIIYVNTKVMDTVEVEAADLNPNDFALHFQGSGGTSFKPAFDWVRDNLDDDPYCLLYFTDMECNDFPTEEPPYPVIWCEFNDLRGFSHWVQTPPWGEHIKIDLND